MNLHPEAPGEAAEPFSVPGCAPPATRARSLAKYELPTPPPLATADDAAADAAAEDAAAAAAVDFTLEGEDGNGGAEKGETYAYVSNETADGEDGADGEIPFSFSACCRLR